MIAASSLRVNQGGMALLRARLGAEIAEAATGRASDRPGPREVTS